MSGASCKVVVDWYAALGAEAAGFSALASEKNEPALAAEAKALSVAAEGICEAGSEMVLYLELEGEHQSDIDAIVQLSGSACDWAADLRSYATAMANHHQTNNTVALWIDEMRGWRDQGTTLIRTLAAQQMGGGS